MIPRTIELKNFLSYGDQVQTIDLKNYDLICLSGKNGHGKTALLDALTWAIWGQARKTSGVTKADDGLIRLGQTKMLVSVEFELNNQVYRIRREYAKTYGKPYAALDFEVFDQTREGFVSLTDKTIRTTQEKIESLLGLDYETFVNTSFLRQGQANEFSKKNPKERKQILATILGLNKYDHLQQQALDKMRQFSDEKKMIDLYLEQIAQELSQEQQLLEKLGLEQKKLELTTPQITTLQNTLYEAEQKKTALTEQKKYLLLITREAQDLSQIYQKKQHELLSLVTQWKNIHQTILKQPDHQALEQEKKLLLQQEKNILATRQKQVTLQEQLLILKETLQQHQNSIKNIAEKSIFEKKIALEKHTATLEQQTKELNQKKLLLTELQQTLISTNKELETLAAKNQSLLATQDVYQKNKKQFEKRRAFYQTFIQKGNWLKNTLQEFEHKKDLVNDTKSPACPLCEQILTAKRKRFLGAKLTTQEHCFKHQLRRIAMLLAKLKELLLEQHEQIITIEKELVLFSQQEEQIRFLQKTAIELSTNHQAQTQEIITLEKQELALKNNYQQFMQILIREEHALEKTVQQNPTVIDLSQKIALLEKEKITLNIDNTHATLISEKIQHLEFLLQNIGKIQEEQQKQTLRKNTLHHLVQELKRLKEQQLKIKQQQETVAIMLQQEDTLITTLDAYKKELTDLIAQKDLSTQQYAKLENEQQRLQKLKIEHEQKQTQLVKLNQEAEDYQTLATAFSKNGIQALLIEEAIPEIEHEANTILSRLTDNQAQIFIESLRDLKSGGVKESLDIHISDTTGIRPYEMYSGGEAFRIDFALRIAISKLLARRAGTALQTLIIDEGFGSQDDEGLTRIMDAIHLIKQDFSKIIIVSHLSELKDNFPVHFIVEKQSSGSIITVEERG